TVPGTSASLGASPRALWLIRSLRTSGGPPRGNLASARELIVEPGPREGEHPGGHHEDGQGTDKSAVCRSARKQRGDVSPEKLCVEQDLECVPPDHGEDKEDQIENAREYGKRVRESDRVQHMRSWPSPAH